MARASAIAEPYTKGQIMAEISENTGLARKDVAKVVEELALLIERHIKKGGSGTFSMPGLFRIRTVRKPATKERKGINPFTKEPTVFKARPARTVIKIRPLKRMKDMV